MPRKENFFNEMEQERQAEKKRLQDPAILLPLLQAAIKEVNEDILSCRAECLKHNWTDDSGPLMPQVTEIVEVIDAEYDFNLRSEHSQVSVYAKDEHGCLGVLYCNSSSYSGSFYEPPDSETNIYWDLSTPLLGTELC